ncbi:fibrinogen-like protein A [Drosophila erecta]|uniref:fibrinogen-like protein A n=1 Tax=Drosophila erecta TaxID=7220 RepID=UPI000F06912E|nr:fibrinogen-like protein A [Drosophila erecta]
MDQLKEALDHNRNIMSEINKKIIKADDLISHSKLKEIANETEGFQVNCSAEDQDLPSNCLGFENGEGIRQIKVPGAKKFYVMCDSKTAGPGWTVVLRNLGNENFNRNWTSYKNGFGSMDSSFFVGLSRLHLMTQSQPHELFIAIYFKHPLHSQFTNSFDNFIVGGASQGYRLESIGNPTSSHFPFIQSQVKAKFTTFDSNNAGTKINYARGTAGWWFTAGNKQSLTQWQIGYEKTLMLIRPKMYL